MDAHPECEKCNDLTVSWFLEGTMCIGTFSSFRSFLFSLCESLTGSLSSKYTCWLRALGSCCCSSPKWDGADVDVSVSSAVHCRLCLSLRNLCEAFFSNQSNGRLAI